MKRHVLLSVLRSAPLWAALAASSVLPWVAACGPRQSPAPAGGASEGRVPLPAMASRPRFSPDGKRLVFHAGPEGQRQIYVMDVGGSDARQLTSGPGDHRDPSFDSLSDRVVYAANAGDTGYDIYLVPARGGTPERVTSLAGDELEPAISTLRYGFYAVTTDACTESGVSAEQLDGYGKVAFTRRQQGDKASEEIWFASLRSAAPIPNPPGMPSFNQIDPAKLSAHAAHQGRISPEGKRCRSPYWAGDGLSVVWLCDDGPGAAVFDAEGRWDQSFAAALAAIGGDQGKSCEFDWEEGAWADDTCLAELPRRYTRYEPAQASPPGPDLRAATISTNQIVLVAENAGRVVHRRRDQTSGSWTPFEGIPAGAHHPVWSPDGSRIAYDVDRPGGNIIATSPTSFYLQSVANLDEFPEWWQKRTSKLLADNHFVAVPGQEKELYVLYEKLRYQRRPQFITADAAMQVFRDEYQTILRQAESEAAKALRQLSKAMMDVYAAAWKTSRSETDRYYATYFATAWVVLEAMSQVPMPDLDQMYGMEPAELEKLVAPPLGRMPRFLPKVYAALPAPLRAEVQARVTAMLAHAGTGDLAVPGRARPARIDWTQFRPRGAYADNELAAYFLAMSWYAAAPLPFDRSLVDLLQRAEATKAEGATVYDLWKRIDTLVGSFMGRPVDATLSHLQAVRSEDAAAFAGFDVAAMRERLERLRGPVPVRDLEAVEGGEGGMTLEVTLFPKRLGLDTTFFRELTHPRVPMRGMPSALDVLAVLGVPRARTHALAAAAEARDQTLAAAYRKALDTLVGEHAKGLAATDIYHAWLAALVALARAHDVPADSAMAFARTDAWQDRLLVSALAGYVELKHSAVLYNMQDNSAECGNEPLIYVLVEQPLLLPPRGFVDPAPAFFDALAGLADRVYRELYGQVEGPQAMFWDDESDGKLLNARSFARDLAALARKQAARQPLTEEEYAWIDRVGGRLEALLLGTQRAQGAIATTPETRNQRGVAIVTDIHTNPMRQQALEIGIGRLLDLWVVVPGQVGERMTQGGMFSFYEFAQPMSDRLTDEQWHERLQAGKAPPLPAWTSSFVEAP
jgi:hypothetical protein